MLKKLIIATALFLPMLSTGIDAAQYDVLTPEQPNGIVSLQFTVDGFVHHGKCSEDQAKLHGGFNACWLL